jgi:transglutaminase-like putative cysteine protease
MGRLAVGWRLRIEHTTRVTYAAPVVSSLNEARMTPLTLPTQTTLQARVTVGSGVPVRTYNDCWGTFVSVIGLPGPHDDLLIRAQATVETGVAVPLPEGKRLSWQEIESASGRPLEFSMPTRLTMVTPETIAAVLEDLRGLSPGETAEAISSRVRSQVAYMPGATGVRTGAQEAWDKGQGVCQDMAHVTVALLRAAGLPARYVAGYLHADPAAEPGTTVAGQGHAWVEYWAGSWTACDPTSGAPVRERHVVVARGRDYADVPPLKGIYRGSPDSTMEVTVEVTRLA